MHRRSQDTLASSLGRSVARIDNVQYEDRLMDTSQVLSKQCRFSSSQDSLDEQQLAEAISSLQESCKDQSQAVF